jgi:hypothetical protein
MGFSRDRSVTFARTGRANGQCGFVGNDTGSMQDLGARHRLTLGWATLLWLPAASERMGNWPRSPTVSWRARASGGSDSGIWRSIRREPAHQSKPCRLGITGYPLGRWTDRSAWRCHRLREGRLSLARLRLRPTRHGEAPAERREPKLPLVVARSGVVA